MKDKNIFTGKDYRITVLTDRLIRLEYKADGVFEDRPTKTVVNRDFSKEAGTCEILSRDEENGNLFIETKSLILTYDKKSFSSLGLSISLKEENSVWHYSVVYGNSDRNLFGTARTLDFTDGFTELEPGIFGHNGYAVLDDTKSPVFENGEYIMPSSEGKDLYFFGYGKDFYGGLKAFYHLCGKNPMVPRYALGNWWSRYCRYTEESYGKLLDNFEKEQIPLSVAVIDMDWHITNVDSKYGTGWTGYTWDKECFPDYRRFLKTLKKRNLAPTLNLHPADGIRGFESMYERVAKRYGADYKNEEPVEFDMADPKFREVYFEEVLHPYEDAGVAFWWIDWQQGTGENGAVDPLFLLNHYHYKDMEDRGKRPMIFSRYAGPGSHRYPVGFSGDTRTTWRSLAYQPYFTATASNIGYGWWSHDIGGHMLGEKDNERLIRWIQFGVFSPVMRIHSNNSIFVNKEPWALPEPYHTIMAEFLRLRHRLIPYIYSELEKSHNEDLPFIRPVYYEYPEKREAFEVSNEYFFGSSLAVCNITEPEDKQLKLAKTSAFIPSGKWYDIFSGHIYSGEGRKRKIYRDIEHIPVLLKDGGIVPESLEDKENGTANPKNMRILFGAGKSGEYELYEDDGISTEYEKGSFVTTRIVMKREDSGECKIVIGPARGDLSLIPKKRSYELWLYGLLDASEFITNGKGVKTDYDEERHILKIIIEERSVSEEISIKIKDAALATNDKKAEVIKLLDRAWIEMESKDRIFWALVENEGNEEAFIARLKELDVAENLKDALGEIFE